MHNSYMRSKSIKSFTVPRLLRISHEAFGSELHSYVYTLGIYSEISRTYVPLGLDTGHRPELVSDAWAEPDAEYRNVCRSYKYPWAHRALESNNGNVSSQEALEIFRCKGMVLCNSRPGRFNLKNLTSA